MNVYQRILNILLEARVDMFIQNRLDERSPQATANRAAKRELMVASGGGDIRKGRANALAKYRAAAKERHPEGQNTFRGLAAQKASGDKGRAEASARIQQFKDDLAKSKQNRPQLP
jgi:hypothetical protein